MAIGEFQQQQNPYEDRITGLLNQRAQMMQQQMQQQAITPESYRAQLFGAMAEGAGPTSFLENIRGQQMQQQQMQQQAMATQIADAETLYNFFEQKRQAGDAQAQKLYENITRITGDDPQAIAHTLKVMEESPEEIDPSNIRQVMNAAVGAMGTYEKPLSQLEQLQLQKERLGVQRAQQQVQMGDIELRDAQTAPKAEYEEIKDMPGYLRIKGTNQAVPIEGLPKDVIDEDKVAEQKAAENNFITFRDEYKNIEGVIDQAIDQTGYGTAGFGGVTGFIPGTPAANLEATLSTIQADAAFSRLQQMRDQSKTGGALGQVSERELSLLSSARAALDQSQSPGQLRDNLKRYKDVRRKAFANVRKAYLQDYGALPAGMYTNADEVKADYANGDLDKEQALTILKEEFGFE